jgi:hypothetical protein
MVGLRIVLTGAAVRQLQLETLQLVVLPVRPEALRFRVLQVRAAHLILAEAELVMPTRL